MGNLRTGAIAACLLLFGCASVPVSADAGFGGSRTPRAEAQSSGPADGHDGVYVGTANVDVNGNYTCPVTMSITGFQVNADVMRFGGFRSRIAADGSVGPTSFRGMWLTGRFEGPKFVGNVDATGDISGQFGTCIYAISVTRATG